MESIAVNKKNLINGFVFFDKKTKTLLNIADVAIIAILVVISGLRSFSETRDTQTYANALNTYFNFGIPNYQQFEPTFWLIAWISKKLFFSSIRFVFFIYATIGVSAVIMAIKKLSRNPYLSIYCYICIFFINHEMTQIRTGIACAIFLLAINDIEKKTFLPFLIKIALASLFHYSAIIAVPFFFLNKSKFNKYLYLVLPFLGMFVSVFINYGFFDIFSSFFPKIAIYVKEVKLGLENKQNVYFNYYMTAIIIFYYISIIGSRKKKFGIDLIVLKLIGLSIFVYYALILIPTFSGRVSDFVGIVAVIFLVQVPDVFKEKRDGEGTCGLFFYNSIIKSDF